MTEYLIIYERGERDEWGAHSPDLPGCVAVGDSREEVEQTDARSAARSHRSNARGG